MLREIREIVNRLKVAGFSSQAPGQRLRVGRKHSSRLRLISVLCVKSFGEMLCEMKQPLKPKVRSLKPGVAYFLAFSPSLYMYLMAGL